MATYTPAINLVDSGGDSAGNVQTRGRGENNLSWLWNSMDIVTYFSWLEFVVFIGEGYP